MTMNQTDKERQRESILKSYSTEINAFIFIKLCGYTTIIVI